MKHSLLPGRPDEEDLKSLHALRGNKAWTQIPHNSPLVITNKAVGCSPFSCTVVVDFCIVLNDNGVDVGNCLFRCFCRLLTFNCLYFLGHFGRIVACQSEHE